MPLSACPLLRCEIQILLSQQRIINHSKDADYDRCWSLATATLHFRFPAEPVADVFDAVIGNALATGDDGANARGAVGR